MRLIIGPSRRHNIYHKCSKLLIDIYTSHKYSFHMPGKINGIRFEEKSIIHENITEEDK